VAHYKTKEREFNSLQSTNAIKDILKPLFSMMTTRRTRRYQHQR